MEDVTGSLRGGMVSDESILCVSVRSKIERTGRRVGQILSRSHRDTEITEKETGSLEVPRCREWVPFLAHEKRLPVASRVW